MTKKEKLVWRLKEQPTAEAVADLVASDVITKDEAREILFSESNLKAKPTDKQKVESLQEQIEFLERVIETLTHKTTATTITYYPSYPRHFVAPGFGSGWIYANSTATNGTYSVNTASLTGGGGGTTLTTGTGKGSSIK